MDYQAFLINSQEMKNEKTDIGVNPDVRFLVKANNSIRFYTQHRFRCSLTVLTDKTKVLYSSFSPVATVEGAITDGLCQVVRLGERFRFKTIHSDNITLGNHIIICEPHQYATIFEQINM